MKPKLILCLALVLSSGLFGCSTMKEQTAQLSPSQQEQVKQTLATLKPGMTEQEVLDTLSKTRWRRLVVHIDGGGSQSDSWDLYSTPQNDNLMLKFDRTFASPKFLGYELCGNGWKQNKP
jgi:hypothetical protein